MDISDDTRAIIAAIEAQTAAFIAKLDEDTTSICRRLDSINNKVEVLNNTEKLDLEIESSKLGFSKYNRDDIEADVEQIVG